MLMREARPDDIAAILILAHAGDARGAETPPLDADSLSDPRYRQAFDTISADPNNWLYVAERNGQIVGTLQITRVPGLSRLGTCRAMLGNVFVDPDHRGAGIGTEMMNWAIAHCRDLGCSMVQLTSNKLRLDAHRFYSRLGFEATHEGFKLYF
jgi:GNAT superfamily N-acetyltransferase